LVGRLVEQGSWHLPNDGNTGNSDGAKLIEKYCLTCHSDSGATRRICGKDFKRLPPDFATGPFAYAPAAADVKWRRDRIAQIIKFGLVGTDMPGHEYLPDAEIAAMAESIAKLSEVKRP